MNKQELKAARYLAKVNPKRYSFQRWEGTIIFIDNRGAFRTHQRQVTRGVAQTFLGHIPLATMIVSEI